MLNEDQIRAVYAEHVKLITDRTRDFRAFGANYEA